MKIVDDSGSDVEDLIQTAEKTEEKHSVIKEKEKEIEKVEVKPFTEEKSEKSEKSEEKQSEPQELSSQPKPEK